MGRVIGARCDRLLGHAEQAQAAGVQVAVCSTSNERSVGQVVDVLIGGDAAPKIKIYAGMIMGLPRHRAGPAAPGLHPAHPTSLCWPACRDLQPRCCPEGAAQGPDDLA